MFCSCSQGSYAKCSHAKELNDGYDLLLEKYDGQLPDSVFQKSFIRKIFDIYIRVNPSSIENIKVITNNTLSDGLFVVNSQGKLLAEAHFPEAMEERFLGRILPDKLSRLHFMRNAVNFVISEQEKELIAMGQKSFRQVTEKSLWFLAAYHLFREYGDDGVIPHLGVDPEQKVCFLSWYHDDKLVFKAPLPDEIVPNIVEMCRTGKPVRCDAGLPGIEQELLFKLDSGHKPGQMAILPVIYYGDTVEQNLVEIDKTYCYHCYCYLPEKKSFITISPDSMKLIATGWGEIKTIPGDEVSAFLETHAEALSIAKKEEVTSQLDLFATKTTEINFARIAYPSIVTSFDNIELNPVKMDATSCTLQINYSSKDHSVSLVSLLDAKKGKKRFLCSPELTVDMKSPAIDSSIVGAKGIGKDGSVTIPKAALMRFKGAAMRMKFSKNNTLTKKIKEMFEFKPLRDFVSLERFVGELRKYQKNCVQWLLFLYDNNFGGLLCDEMGLGKTIETIAFLGALREQRECRGPHLVVCPASVLEYWERQLKRFLPGVRVKTHYSGNRDNAIDITEFDVMITTFGILRNDIEMLSAIKYQIVIFDEIQQLKNSASLSSAAAFNIDAVLKLGLTGTPIENNAQELKTLFNLTIPGLFGMDLNTDQGRFIDEQGAGMSDEERKSIQRIIEPFMLRRLKMSVLTELPAKIEEVRYCELIGSQNALYREVLEERGGPLLESLKKTDEPIQYINFYSLFSYLKQICNHPGSLVDNTEEYVYSESGKWELFKELLDECLGSNQKVVVFSQYLKMLDIIKLHCGMIGVGTALLTGKTVKRDALVQQFANDPQCRVFICSLKTGGVGIDLTPASTVIHYDRWWNAAREDQATDRVHRFGQTHGVEVFKLVTRDSIEERIDSIIHRKRILSYTHGVCV
ncbi:MAG TPA: DEAD/DEAH box helicase, partial [Chitinispirillaceae bacterium]|nr:DEAD/DEAH box helicase [Chitinispirillaceae bacterium]